MLDRSRSPAALRASERRARRRAGIAHDLTVRVPTRRLIAAMRAANPRLPEGELNREAIEAELQAVVDTFIERWIGAQNKAHA
jgi:hypothetical protein